MGALEGCAPRKTSVLGAKYDTRERGIHETFGKKNPCLPEPSIQIREAPVLGYRSCTGGIIFSWLLRVAGSACITVCKENFFFFFFFITFRYLLANYQLSNTL